AAEFRRGIAFRNFDGSDHVVADNRGRVRVDDPATIINQNKRAVDAYGGEHCSEESGLIFAVAIAVAEDVAGVVGLMSPYADFNDKVPHLFLNKLGDGFSLIVEVGLVAGEFFGLCGDLRGGDETVFREVLIPLADALPCAFRGGRDSWARVVDGHATLERGRIGTERDLIEVNCGRVFHLPAPALVLEVDGGNLFGMGPDGAVGKAWGKLEGEALVEARDLTLEEPGFFGEVWMAALLVFECNDTAGVAGRSVSGSHFQVHEKIALAGIAYFGHLVVFDGVLVAVGADAPDVHGEDFAVLVEGDGDDAFVP